MAASMKGLTWCCRRKTLTQIPVRWMGKVNIKRPYPRPLPRRIFEVVTKPVYLPEEIPPAEKCSQSRLLRQQEQENPYEEFLVGKWRNVFEKNKLIVVVQPLPLDSNTKRSLKVQFRKKGFQLLHASNKLISQAIRDTKHESMLPWFVGTNDVIVSPEPNVAELLAITKKMPDLYVLGGFVEDRLLTKAGLHEVSLLPSIEQLRGELVSILNLAGGSRTLSLLNSHQQQLVTNLGQLVKQGTEAGEPGTSQQSSTDSATVSGGEQPGTSDSAGGSET